MVAASHDKSSRLKVCDGLLSEFGGARGTLYEPMESRGSSSNPRNVSCNSQHMSKTVSMMHLAMKMLNNAQKSRDNTKMLKRHPRCAHARVDFVMSRKASYSLRNFLFCLWSNLSKRVVKRTGMLQKANHHDVYRTNRHIHP